MGTFEIVLTAFLVSLFIGTPILSMYLGGAVAFMSVINFIRVYKRL